MSPAWVRQLLKTLDKGPCVLVTLRQHKGSAPRESGARMVVNESDFSGSIGGGNLEYQAIATAREMLKFRHPGKAEGLVRDPLAGTEAPTAHTRRPGSPKATDKRHPGKAEGLVRDPLAGTEAPGGLVGPGQHALRHSSGASFAARKPHRLRCLRYSRFRDDDFPLREAGKTGGPRLEPYGLGPALNQCCGGSVELLFEYLAPPTPGWLTALSEATEHGDHAALAVAVNAEAPRHHVALPVGRESALPEGLRAPIRKILDDAGHTAIDIVEADGCTWWLQRIAANRRQLLLFGAGHVGKAVVKALADLPFEVRWLDARAGEFSERTPANTTVVQTDDPLAAVSAAAPATTYIVMTHSHDLDEDICHAVLERGDFAFLGLIGSSSKRRRFVHRLAKRGIDEQALERLVCPIGLPDIRGKEPATIALSLAAQLMSEPQEG